MKMKKTVAGVLAGAMAVSAMAATVSADGQETISLTYDLKTYIEDIGQGKITFVATYADATNGNAYIIPTDANGDAALGFNILNTPVDVNGYQYLGSVDGLTKDGNYGAYAVEVLFKARTFSETGANSTNVSNTIKFIRNDDFGNDFFDPFKGSYDYVVSDDVFNKTVNGVLWDVYIPITINPANTQNGVANLVNFDLATLGYATFGASISTADAIAAGYVTDYLQAAGFSGITARIWYKIPNQVKTDVSNYWGWTNPSGYTDANGVWRSDTITRDLWAALGIDYTADGKPELKAYNAVVNSYVSTLAATPTQKGWTGLTTQDKTEKIYPFRTNLKPADYSPDGSTVLRTDDVIYALKTRKSGGNFYTYPLSVLNDAIANNEKVTFTFTGYDGYVTTANSHVLKQWVEPFRAYGWQTGSQDWKSPTFGQHLYANGVNIQTPYNTTTDVSGKYTGQAANPSTYDQYGSYSQAWAVNLFTGAIVVNSEVTMQLNDTDKFQWGANTLSFVWQDIIDDGKITNAKQLLTSMLLYTPTEWFWDQLTVNVEAGAAEDVDNAAGLEGEGEELVEEEEEPVEEVEIEEPEFEEEVVEETEAPAPVEPAPSPKTGNAPIALAVIPVALAAAAVVAKKRG
ncbi:MAG: hypothetical protein IKR73_09290 [Oscillospiraceae bacterium]|nr:hypothetical protein [Oscillospiraceae bacterium]